MERGDERKKSTLLENTKKREAKANKPPVGVTAAAKSHQTTRPNDPLESRSSGAAPRGANKKGRIVKEEELGCCATPTYRGGASARGL
jgi:hypothetical protein